MCVVLSKIVTMKKIWFNHLNNKLKYVDICVPILGTSVYSIDIGIDKEIGIRIMFTKQKQFI